MILERFDLAGLSAAGFQGFVPIRELRAVRGRIPAVRGVYVFFRSDESEPEFLETGTGGYFKGKNPNVDVETLALNWVPGAHVVYIGKAGDPGQSATLRSRLWQYLRFGAGANVGHWGGRYVWQLADAESLLVAWCELPNGVPSEIETELIAAFRADTGMRPFANLAK